MNAEMSTKLNRWIGLINQKPNYTCDYFYLSDDGKVMIIDLKKMPKTLDRFPSIKDCEQKYLMIGVMEPKEARFYGFTRNKKSASGDLDSEVSGHLAFNDIADELLSFLEENALDLSKWDMPFTQVMESLEEQEKKSAIIPSSSITKNYDYRHTHQYQQHYNHQHPNNWQINSNYKEREAFNDKVYAMVKFGQSSQAVDYIDEFCVEAEKDLMNSILSFISIDKLDIITARELLRATKAKANDYLSRNTFAGKFQEVLKRYSRPRKITYVE